MDNLLNTTYTSYNRYFNVLEKLGYKNYNDVNKLLIELYIIHMLDVYKDYLEEDDIRSLNNAFYCLSESTCLIDFPNSI